MYFVLRVDLDYVPWDTPDAAEFGHGEPAMLLRILDLARQTGYKLQFFASNRVLRAFPATGEAVLNDGHDLDWLCKHPEDAQERYEEAKRLFAGIGHRPRGLATKAAWSAGMKPFPGLEELEFLSATSGAVPKGLAFFPVEVKPTREAARSGLSARAWTDSVKLHVRDAASRNQGVTVAVRPQVLAKFDARLTAVREILDLSRAVGLPIVTMRDVVDGKATPD